MSPIKRSRKGTEYCEFTFTSANDVERGVCFSMKLRRELVTNADSNMPVECSHISGSDDLIFNHETVINQLTHTTLPFTRESVKRPMMSIADLDDIKIHQVYML